MLLLVFALVPLNVFNLLTDTPSLNLHAQSSRGKGLLNIIPHQLSSCTIVALSCLGLHVLLSDNLLVFCRAKPHPQHLAAFTWCLALQCLRQSPQQCTQHRYMLVFSCIIYFICILTFECNLLVLLTSSVVICFSVVLFL